jgi:hypothetical protein
VCDDRTGHPRTALYVKTDDLLKKSPGLAPWRPAAGAAPRLGDAELVTLAVMQALAGFTSEARWVRHARVHLRHLFPYLPRQPGYNKRLRAAAALIRHCIRVLAADASVWTDDVWVVDSIQVECGRSRKTARRSDLAGWAEYGFALALVPGPAAAPGPHPAGPARRLRPGRCGSRGRQELLRHGVRGDHASARITLLRPARTGESREWPAPSSTWSSKAATPRNFTRRPREGQMRSSSRRSASSLTCRSG